jgi:hypothetical protein
VISLADTTVTLVAADPPKSTAVAEVKSEPVIVTDVPPVVDPSSGLTAVTEGSAAITSAPPDPEISVAERYPSPLGPKTCRGTSLLVPTVVVPIPSVPHLFIPQASTVPVDLSA